MQSIVFLALLGAASVFGANSVDAPPQTVTRDEEAPSLAFQEDQAAMSMHNDTDSAVPAPAPTPGPMNVDGSQSTTAVTGQPTVTEFKYTTEHHNTTGSSVGMAVFSAIAAVSATLLL